MKNKVANNDNMTFWKKSLLIRHDGRNYLFRQYVTQYANYNKRFINFTELNGQQAVFNSQYNHTFTGKLIDGFLEICPPGCMDCDCSDCLSGFSYD